MPGSVWPRIVWVAFLDLRFPKIGTASSNIKNIRQNASNEHGLMKTLLSHRISFNFLF